MKIAIEGKTCTLSMRFTRLKALLTGAAIILCVGFPVYSCKNAQEKLLVVQSQTAPTQLLQASVTEPVLTPYTLTEQSKTLLRNWLGYGYRFGYKNMMETYEKTNGNSETSKMFRYLLDSEWRAGGWEYMNALKKS